jgi:hypothetical protein
MTDSSPKRVKTTPDEKPSLIYVVSRLYLYHDYKRADASCNVTGAFLSKERAWEEAFEGIARGHGWESVLDYESEEGSSESSDERHQKHSDKLAEIKAMSESWEKKAKILVDYIESVAGDSDGEWWQVQSTELKS